MTPVAVVIDTATPIPGAVLAAAGVTCVVRYLSSIPGRKVITAAEYADLRAHGIQVLLVYEDTATDMEAGLDAGILHGKTAVWGAGVVGYPQGTALYFACDSNAIEPSTRDTLSGATFIVQHYGYRRGWYGRADVGREALAGNMVDLIWAVDTWPGGVDLTNIALVQHGNNGQRTIGGVTVDIDSALIADFGQAA